MSLVWLPSCTSSTNCLIHKDIRFVLVLVEKQTEILLPNVIDDDFGLRSKNARYFTGFTRLPFELYEVLFHKVKYHIEKTTNYRKPISALSVFLTLHCKSWEAGVFNRLVNNIAVLLCCQQKCFTKMFSTSV